MAPKVQHKRSAVKGKAPLPADLEYGEIAVNYEATDPALYIKDSADAVRKIGNQPAATETVAGIVELATAAETTTGTDATRAVHPAGLKVELDKKAPLDSPALTGTPTAPTAAAGTNTTQLATTAFVADAVSKENLWDRTGTTLAPATAGDVVTVSAGTAALPGLTPVGDPNTGIWSPGADQLAISTGGASRVHVAADGKVGIGTSTPHAALEVAGALQVGNQSNGDGTTPVSSTNGLFIGTRQTTGSGTEVFLQTNAYPTIGAASSPDQAMVFSGWSGGGSWHNAIKSGQGQFLSFHTGISATTYTDTKERARIDSSGRLLVGTSSTSATLTALLQGSSRGATSNAGLMLARGEAPAADGTVLGALDYAANNHVIASRILCKQDGGTWTAGTSQPTRLEFSTCPDGGATPVERMRISNDGRLLIGTQSTINDSFVGIATSLTATNGITIRNTVAQTIGQNFIYFSNSAGALAGSISHSGTTSVTYATSSDYRLKENVVPLTGAIDRVNQLQPSQFNFIADPGKTVDGFIAHEAQAVVPECVTGTKDEVDADGNPVYQGIDQSKLVPLLTAALQEAIGRIETLEAEVAALKAS